MDIRGRDGGAGCEKEREMEDCGHPRIGWVGGERERKRGHCGYQRKGKGGWVIRECGRAVRGKGGGWAVYIRETRRGPVNIRGRGGEAVLRAQGLWGGL